MEERATLGVPTVDLFGVCLHDPATGFPDRIKRGGHCRARDTSLRAAMRTSHDAMSDLQRADLAHFEGHVGRTTQPVAEMHPKRADECRDPDRPRLCTSPSGSPSRRHRGEKIRRVGLDACGWVIPSGGARWSELSRLIHRGGLVV